VDERFDEISHSAAAPVFAFQRTEHAKVLSKVEKCDVTDHVVALAN